MTRIILETRTNGIMEFFAPAEGDGYAIAVVSELAALEQIEKARAIVAAEAPVAAPSGAVGRPKIYPNGVQPPATWRPKTPAIRAKYSALGGSRWLNEYLAALVQQDAVTMAKK